MFPSLVVTVPTNLVASALQALVGPTKDFTATVVPAKRNLADSVEGELLIIVRSNLKFR